MLKLAYPYKDRLQSIAAHNSFDEKYKYWTSNVWLKFTEEIKEDTWDYLQYVSVDANDEIVGYISAAINHASKNVTSLSIINFGKPSAMFIEDVMAFVAQLFFKFHYRKVAFNVLVGNPAEKIYDKLISVFGGRVVGTYKRDVLLWDNQYYDSKLYEILDTDLKIHEDFWMAMDCDPKKVYGFFKKSSEF